MHGRGINAGSRRKFIKESVHLADPDVDGRIILKWLSNMMGDCGLASSKLRTQSNVDLLLIWK